MIPLFYRPEQSSDAAESFSPSAGKPKLVIEDWLSRPEIAQIFRLNHLLRQRTSFCWCA